MQRVRGRSCEFFAGAVSSLTLYVQYLAWLDAVPEKQQQPRSELLGFIDYPELPEGFEYLIEYLDQLGWGREGFNGLVALNYQEIQAWLALSFLELTPWEVQTMRALSSAYCAQLRKSFAPDAPAPYVSEEAEAFNERQVVDVLKRLARVRR